MRNVPALILTAVSILACQPGSEPVMQEPTLREASPGLLARATVPADRARAIALARTGGGSLVEAELEEENGVLVYSYDIRLGNGALIAIEVDARSGQVLREETEEPGDEADDAGAEDDEDDVPAEPSPVGARSRR